MQSKNFESTFESINTFMLKIEDLIREIVTQNNLPYYRIESRMDDYVPTGAEDTYAPVIRIVTYFEDTVTQISEILNNEFDISTEKVLDRKKARVENFSYKHFNYIATLKDNRRRLTEYKRSGNQKFEIQVCSMLQDALSGIGKEFGYDNSSIPEDAKRDFYRVSALLEMADMEFLKIRSKLSHKGTNKSAAATPLVEANKIAEVAPVAPAQPVPPQPEIAAATNGTSEKNALPEQLKEKEETAKDTKSAPIELPQTTQANPSATPAGTEGAKRRAILSNMDKVVIVNVNAHGVTEKATEKPQETAPEKPAAAFFEDRAAEQEQQLVKHTPADENAQITEESLREYVFKSSVLKDVDMQIAERAGARINPEIDIEGDVERLRFLKVHTIKQLHEKITDNKDEVVAFAEKWIGKDNGGSFDSGISLFYLEYLLVGKKNDPAFAVEYVVKFISDNDYSARYIIPTYNSIRSIENPTYSHLTLKA